MGISLTYFRLWLSLVYALAARASGSFCSPAMARPNEAKMNKSLAFIFSVCVCCILAYSFRCMVEMFGSALKSAGRMPIYSCGMMSSWANAFAAADSFSCSSQYVLIASTQLPYWYKRPREALPLCRRPRMGPRFGPITISWTTSGRRDQSFCVLTSIYIEARPAYREGPCLSVSSGHNLDSAYICSYLSTKWTTSYTLCYRIHVEPHHHFVCLN